MWRNVLDFLNPSKRRERVEELGERVSALEADAKATEHFTAVGVVTVFWAAVEVGLDYSNAFILRAVPAGADLASELPRAFDRKLELFERGHTELDALAPYRRSAEKIALEAKRLKDNRHDFIHGLVVQLGNPVHYQRLHLKGLQTIRLRRRYSRRQVNKLREDMRLLAVATMAHAEALAAAFVPPN